MTAFSRMSIQASWANIVWEIRTVNHRYLEINLRLPDGCRDLEMAIRQKIRHTLSRGKVEVFLKIKNEATSPHLSVNQVLIKRLSEELKNIQPLFEPQARAVNLVDLLAWPGVIDSADELSEAQKEAVLNGFDLTLMELNRCREREGEALVEFINARLIQIQQHVDNLQPHLATFFEDQRNKLKNRIAAEQIILEPQRLEQELVIWAQKMDVSEELDRIKLHLQEVKRTLGSPQPIGRQLDFLMQELNREANTLGSKSFNIETTNTSVAIKVLIEQMREQIQNLE